MSDFRTETSLGGRIKALRKSRGVRSTTELSELTGGAVSAFVLQNVESGRRQDISISALLNLAMALKVAPGFLLAPMARPDDALDLQNLSEGFEGMNVAEFDSWVAGLPDGPTRSAVGDDRNERNELQALRELVALARERRRLSVMAKLDDDRSASSAVSETTSRRLREADAHIADLTSYLSDAGWDIGEWTSRHA